MEFSNFKQYGLKVHGIDDNHAERLDNLLDEIKKSDLTPQEKEVLKHFVASKKSYAEVKKWSNGNDQAFSVAGRQLDVFINFFFDEAE